MLVEFDAIDDHSRLWIYQLSRSLSIVEEESFLNQTLNFLKDWAAHGSNLSASAKISDHRILVIAVDESRTGASGCSIDSQVVFLKRIEQSFAIDLFKRDSIFYKEDSFLKSMDINEFKNKVASGGLSENTLFYNTTINKKEQLKEGFLIPVKGSWLMRMIKV